MGGQKVHLGVVHDWSMSSRWLGKPQESQVYRVGVSRILHERLKVIGPIRNGEEFCALEE